MPLAWSKKLTKSTENCYNIQEARVIDRAKGRIISPIRIKNKNRSPSPSTHSIASNKSSSIISTSTPTHSILSLTYSHRSNNREKRIISNVFDGYDDDDKEVILQREEDYSSLTPTCHIPKNNVNYSYRKELSRTIGFVPYREKRNPLINARFSCYKPSLDSLNTIDQQPPNNHLKNYKSVEDFFSMDIKSESSTSPTSSERCNNGDEAIFVQEKNSKRPGLGRKFRSISDKTQKLFSKFYQASNNTLRPTTELSNDFTIIQPKKLSSSSSSSVSHNRRSLSYGMLPDLKDNEVLLKKIETAEDGDSGILVNESEASSMVEAENEEKSRLIKSNCQFDDKKLNKTENLNEKFIQR